MVILDTSVLVRFLREPQNEIAEEVRRLLETKEGLAIGIVVTEVLQGARKSM
ncbi:MAG: PIN domain nuclease [SAR202 cluster bacterium]|nr:PIN domain nuclease [SAR202 cluster bacterium]